jgi:shikimate dehydrogenase
VVGTIGYPVDHSLSPRLHEAAFEALGLDWVSVGFPVKPGEAATALRGGLSLGIVGLSVTMPHKAEAAQAADELTPLAARLGAVNCVTFDEGRMVGDSTDGAGLLRVLEREAQFEAAGRRCVVIGAGGAARAAVAALADAGAAEVVVVNRTLSRAEKAARLAGPTGRTGTVEDIEAADLVVQATPFGMVGNDEVLGIAPLEVLAEVFRQGQVVIDLVYAPRWTPILEAASERGALAVGGLGMLVFQAAIALEHWTGTPAPVDAMFEAAEEAVSTQEASRFQKGE